MMVTQPGPVAPIHIANKVPKVTGNWPRFNMAVVLAQREGCSHRRRPSSHLLDIKLDHDDFCSFTAGDYPLQGPAAPKISPLPLNICGDGSDSDSSNISENDGAPSNHRKLSKATIRDGDDDDPERVIGEEGKRKRESRVTFVEGYVSDIHVFLTTNSYSECFTSIC